MATTFVLDQIELEGKISASLMATTCPGPNIELEGKISASLMATTCPWAKHRVKR